MPWPCGGYRLASERGGARRDRDCRPIEIAGQLQPKQPRLFALGKPIEFLRHSLQLCIGVLLINPSSEDLKAFDITLQSGLRAIRKLALMDASKKEVGKANVGKAKLRRYVRSWAAAFKICTAIGARREFALKRIATVTLTSSPR